MICEWYYCPHKDEEIEGIVAVMLCEDDHEHYLHPECLEGFRYQLRMEELNDLYIQLRLNALWN